jgi:hypothetical protein
MGRPRGFVEESADTRLHASLRAGVDHVSRERDDLFVRRVRNTEYPGE